MIDGKPINIYGLIIELFNDDGVLAATYFQPQGDNLMVMSVIENPEETKGVIFVLLTAISSFMSRDEAPSNDEMNEMVRVAWEDVERVPPHEWWRFKEELERRLNEDKGATH